MGLGLELTVVPRQNGPRKMITENNKDYLSLSLSPSPPPPSPPVIKQGIYFSRRALGRRQLLRFSCCAEQAGGVLGFILGVGGGELGGSAACLFSDAFAKKGEGREGLRGGCSFGKPQWGPLALPLCREPGRRIRGERGAGDGARDRAASPLVPFSLLGLRLNRGQPGPATFAL